MKQKQMSTKEVISVVSALAVSLLIAGVMIIFTSGKPRPTPAVAKAAVSQVQAPVADPPIEKKIDKEAIRAKAKTVAEAKLVEAEKEFAAAAVKLADKHLAAIDEFFKSREDGIKPFAKEILSLGGKVKFARGQIWQDEQAKHAEFIRTEFEKHVFTPGQLSEVVSRCIQAYLAELQGLENEFLIKLRADLSESDPDSAKVFPALESQQTFDAEFKRVAALSSDLIGKDLKTDVAREVASFIAAEIATKLGLKILGGIGTKLGISGGILTVGAGSALATFGVGLIVAIIIDALIGKAQEATGNDPATKVAERVKESLGGVRDSIKDGVPEAKRDWKELLNLAKSDPEERIRKAAAEAAEAISNSGNLGLRRELLQVQELRATVRREAIGRLIAQGEMP